MMNAPEDSPIKDCGGAMARLFDLLDGELTPDREQQLREHITSCPDCFTHADFEKRFLAAVAAARAQGPAPDSLRQRVLESLRSEGFTGLAR